MTRRPALRSLACAAAVAAVFIVETVTNAVFGYRIMGWPLALAEGTRNAAARRFA